MKKFKFRRYNSNQNNIQSNILDIWCQKDRIVAYVEGTKIYKTELIIKNNRIANYYCSCPSSDGGMNFCKHLSGVENYLENKAILELEDMKEKEEKLDFGLTLKQILIKFKEGSTKFLSNDNSINCYQSSFFSDYVFKYCIYIDRFLDNKEPQKAFFLVTEYINYLDTVYIYCVDDADDINEILINYLVTLAINYNYFNKIGEYLLKKYQNQKLDELGENIISNIIPIIKVKEQAENYIKLLQKMQIESYQETQIKEYISILKTVGK